MNVFDQPDNFPPIFFHAWEYLKTHGPTLRDELACALAPPSFAKTAHVNVKSTMNLGIRIHVFDVNSDFVSNSTRTNSCIDFNSFRRAVRDIYFDQNVNSYSDLKLQKGNLQLAVAWFLSFPYDQTPGTWKHAEKQLPKDFSKERTQNDTQWTGFERWTRFLGLGIRGIGRSDSLILQPCINEFVHDVIDGLPGGSRTSIREFVDKLTLRYPSLPGGLVFNDLPSGVSNRVTTRNTSLIAQALRDAESQKLIKLEAGVDVADREVFSVDAGEFNADFIVKDEKK
jgi:hypothetical protein